MNKSISIKSLSKNYKSLKVLENININIERGKIIGLIGSNGSGKSTLLKIILGFISYNQGGVFIGDNKIEDVDIIDIGFYIRDANFYPNFTGYQNLSYFLCVKEKNLERFDDLYKMFQMKEDMNRKYKTYSLGMKQRFGLIFTLMQKKGFYLLDEPMSSLDFQGKKEFKSVIRESVKNFSTGILIVSHQLENLEGFCDEIWYIKNKSIKMFDTKNKDIRYILTFADEKSCNEVNKRFPLKIKRNSTLSLEIKVDLENEIEDIIRKISDLSLREVVNVTDSIKFQYENTVIGENHEK